MTIKLRKILLLIVVMVFVGGAANAQSLRAYIKAAENAYATHDYFTALVYFKKIIEVEPERNDIQFKYAEAAREFQAYRIAEDAYEKIIAGRDSLNYPLATFWLATVQKNLGKYEEAEATFSTYLKKFKRVNARYSKKAEKNIIDCKWAAKAVRSNMENIKVEHLEGEINTPYSEFGGVEFGGEIYFSSMQFENKRKQLYSKLMKKNKYGLIETYEFNKDNVFAANPALSFDGQRLFYTNCEYDKAGNIKCAIVFREKNYVGEWGVEQDLPTFINFPGYTTTHPSIGYDKINEREILFFSSNRPGGKGKMDLWFATFAPNGKLTRPVNHAMLNTRDNDVTPFFHSPSQTLYFSSDGYPGMGGYDIYKVKRNGRSWQTPVHMVFPVNSSYNDFYFSLDESGTKSYFSSNREEALEIDPEKEACCNDLFSAKIKADKIDLTKDEYLAFLNNEVITGLAANEDDEPKVILKSYPDIETETNPDDIPETILGGKSTEIVEGEIIINGSNAGEDKIEIPSLEELISKGNETTIPEGNETITPKDNIESPVSSTGTELVFEENFETLSKEIYSIVFEVEALDMDLEPLSGVTVEFLEMENNTRSKNFRKSNISGNKIKFRIKNDVGYKIVLSKPGFVTDTFTIDKELLEGATDLSQPFFMSELETGSIYPESPMAENLKEEVVTDEMLKSYLPIRLYFNNNEPDPTSWSNTSSKNYEQTYLLYYSKKDRFKDQTARKYATSQREEALAEVDYFFQNELKKGFQDLVEFSNQLIKYLEKGNQVTIGLQAVSGSPIVSDKNKSLYKRRMSTIENHFMTHFSGKLRPYLEAGILSFETLDPMIITSNTNGTYSPDASKLRRVEIKILKLNQF